MPTPSSSQIPARSEAQRLEALRKANQVRADRATLKRDIKGGVVHVADVIADPPPCVHSAKVIDILMSAPKRGRVKATRALTQCRISHGKTVGGLSDRQRAELVELLRR